MLKTIFDHIFLGASASGAPHGLIRLLLVVVVVVLLLVVRGHFLKLAFGLI